ncbi:MAG: response regulator [Gammaproteobacteria bacterium]|nr:response regulator [Gammaproteobacteria bacterium]
MTILLKDIRHHPLSAEVMVVDDQPTSRIILETILRSIGDNIRVTGYESPLDALRDLESGLLPDLIVADYYMPGMDGIAFTRDIRRLPACHDIPLVIITVVEQRKVMYEALEAGATDFLTKPVDHYECKVRCRNLLTLRRQQSIIRSRAHAHQTNIVQSVEDLRQREREALTRLALICARREHGTGDPLRVGRVARRMAMEMGLGIEFCESIELAAPLHDIGRIGIPDAILFKPGPLTPDEAGIMRSHTRIGYDLLKDSASPALQMGARIALHHHESFDGSGYPQGLGGDDIPLEARIVAAADRFYALNSARPYKTAWPAPVALAEIRRLGGRSLDPACVEALLRCAEFLTPDGPGSVACET